MVRLTSEEREMLAGYEGEAKRLSMELLVKAAEAFQAERLIPIASCHLVISLYKGALKAALETAEKFEKMGARFSVPTTMDPSSMDFERWKEFPSTCDCAGTRSLAHALFTARVGARTGCAIAHDSGMDHKRNALPER